MKPDSIKDMNRRITELFNLPPTWVRGTIKFGYNEVPMVELEFIPQLAPEKPEEPK